MTTLDFLGHLRGLGVRVTVEEGTVRCRAPKGVLTPTLLEELQRRKTELLPYFMPEAGAAGGAGEAAAGIPRVSREGELPLSLGQQRLWFLDRLTPLNPAYNVCAGARLTGVLDAGVLQETFSTIAARHETLRTTFRAVDGHPVQVIHPAGTVPLPLTDLSDDAPAAREMRMRQLAEAHGREPFDLAEGPLFRAALVRLGATDHLLSFSMHHAITDGWSLGIMVRELAAIYTALVSGQPIPLPALSIQYADYTAWQRQRLTGAALDQMTGYWKQQLAGAPGALPLGTRRAHAAGRTNRGRKEPLVLSAAVTEALVALSHRDGLTLFMTLMSALSVLLARYTGERDVPVGFPVANRSHPQLEALIGFFANTLVLRHDLSGRPTFRALTRRVREATLDALTHQDLPFDQLTEILHPDRELDANPLFQVMFALQNEWLPSMTFAGLRFSPMEVDNRAAKVNLNVALSESAGRLQGWMEFRRDLFDPADMRRMTGHFHTLLASVVAHPDAPIHALPMLSDAERRAMIGGGAADGVARGAGDEAADRVLAGLTGLECLDERFDRQASRTPTRTAVVCGDGQVTYADLQNRATRLAVRLRALGVGPDVPVAFYLDRSVDLITAILGIWKAGGAYLPLDPTLPPERIAFMVEDARPRVLLTHTALAAQLADSAGAEAGASTRLLCIDMDAADADDARTASGESRGAQALSPDRLAYLIYTSGSTGTPKAVAITQRSAVHLVEALRTAIYADLGPAPLAIGLNGPLAFDTTVKQIVQITQGHTLHILPDALRADPPALLARLRAAPLDVLDCTPSQLRLLIAAGLLDDPRTAALTMLVGGEAIDDPLWARLAAARDRRFYNLYGPTECTVDATACRVQASQADASASVSAGAGVGDEQEPRKSDDDHETDVSSGAPTIGRELARVRAYVLDRDAQLAPIGVAGELHIAGAGVARGYHRRPALTADAFRPDPFGGEPGGRMYRTGDLTRRQPSGDLEFLGRADRLVKLRGRRVELQEIEAALCRHPKVRQAIVILHEYQPGDERLAAYIVSSSAPPARAFELQRFLRERLPGYMVPAAFVLLDELPVNANGKVDLQRLPAPAGAHVDRPARGQAPRDLLELELARIWEELLHVRPIGVTDNFFDLGGHSFLAVLLIARVARRFGRELPLATLFRGATIEQLASVLREEGAAGGWSPLVAIQPGGMRPPFFCVHPIGGNVLCYLDLADALGVDQPFYGLQADHAADARPESRSIEAMAARYVEAIRGRQPHGPYRLGGWSMGGMIAFEMARQLLAAGESIALLALLDSRAPGEPRASGPATEKALLKQFATDLAARAGKSPEPLHAVLSASGSGRVEDLMDAAIAEGLCPPDVTAHQLRALVTSFIVNVQAVRDYAPRAARLALTVWQSEASAAAWPGDRTMGWSAFAELGVSCLAAPGSHYGMMRRPQVDEVARMLAAALADAGAETAANVADEHAQAVPSGAAHQA